MTETFTMQEVARHTRPDDCFIVVDGGVYDLTKFLKLHPGGHAVLIAYAGKDATEAFYGLHREEVLDKYKQRLLKGTVAGSMPKYGLKSLPRIAGRNPAVEYDSQVPFAEPSWMRSGWRSPRHNNSHVEFRNGILEVLQEHLIPDCWQWEAEGSPPSAEVYQALCRDGFLASHIAVDCRPHLARIPEVRLPGRVAADTLDYFHELITFEELARLLPHSVGDGIRGGFVIGSPPIIHYAAPNVFLEDVHVPVANLLGVEGEGFKAVMANFNHERFFMVAGMVGALRKVVQECLTWAVQRRAFGQPLAAQPVIRAKLARIIAMAEATSAWTESITYQMTCMDYKDQNARLGGPLALLKYHASRNITMALDEATQIFGGRGITATGMGKVIEGINRGQKYFAILGGSEEIMADLGVRQALKDMPAFARL
eukprot:NODE_7857_length_1544_cov_5.150318.p1 GENE.NODE_7857_length_1544_cov_5.150318~~NODE_7857_length_1544_cov_5.150318.p1  ORF type:complete len:426 (-),score=107.64 NODE_7857_length_1544_cov_5.150318:245-1522(-)